VTIGSSPRGRTLAAALALLLGACTVFAPRFDPLVSAKANGAFTQVAELLSAVELGKYESAQSFPAAIDTYAAIDGQLAAAAQRASLLDAPTGPSQRARELLQGHIDACRKQVMTLAQTHKRAGLAPNSGMTTGVLVSCDVAARAADAMK
jgi:hypothetical protein